MIHHKYTCTIYPYTTTEVDEQEIEWYSTTASYSWACNYWDWSWTYTQWQVIQNDSNRKMVDLPSLVSISDLSKVVLDNWKTYKVVKSDPRKALTFSHTLLTCEHTNG